VYIIANAVGYELHIKTEQAINSFLKKGFMGLGYLKKWQQMMIHASVGQKKCPTGAFFIS